MREKRKPMPNYCISISRDEDIVSNPGDFIIATLLCSYLARRDEVSNGEIPQARRRLCHEPWRCGMMISGQDAERVLAGDSAFWHWEGERLVVDLFDTEAEAKFAKRCKVARNNAKNRWEKDKAVATAHATADATADATANATAHATAYANGGYNKERNDFLTENLSNAGGSAAAMPPALGEQEQRQQAARQLVEALALVESPATAAPSPTAAATAEPAAGDDAPPCPAPTATCPTSSAPAKATNPTSTAPAKATEEAAPPAPTAPPPVAAPPATPPPAATARPGSPPAPPAGKEVSHG